MPNYKDTAGKVHFLDSVEFEYLLPAGCVRISDDEAAELTAPPVESQAEILARAIVDIRAQRAPILTALAGIGFDALESEDTTLSAAIAKTRQDLKDVTSLTALAEASTYEEMRAVVMTRYREIAAAAPDALQTAFREVFAAS